MVNTSISDIASAICQNPAEARSITGILAADTYPGQACVLDNSTGKWTKADSDTAAHKLKRIAVPEYRRRKNNADGVPTIDEVYDIDAEPALDLCVLYTKGKVSVYIDDPAATYYPGQEMMISATAGNLKVAALEATGATSGTALRSVIVATLAEKIVSGDTKAWVILNGWEMTG